MLLFEDIKAKARWCYGDVTAKTIVKTCLTDGTAAMFWYRCMQWCRKWKLAPLTMICGRINGLFCQCIIGRGAEFGPGFVIIHSNGIVINSSVRGGRNIHLEHQVTIGAEKDVSPILGDNIFVGAGAKIVGGVSIGSESRIGANAVVTKDVPAWATVGGVPAKIIRQRSPDLETTSEFQSTPIPSSEKSTGDNPNGTDAVEDVQIGVNKLRTET